VAIHQWPKHQQPREKLLSKGSQTLSDAELLAIFLRTGIAGQSAISLAQNILSQCGSLRELLDKPPEYINQLPGLGPAKYASLQAALEISRRYIEQGLYKKHIIKSHHDAINFLILQLRQKHHEVFACLFLDTQHRLIRYEELFQGTIDGANVYPREVVKRALLHNAAAVIFAHNHPSGNASPSIADQKITDILIKALKTVDIRVLDHIVIGELESCSFAKLGWL